MEISGAMGDLGTYIPIVVALSIQCVREISSLPLRLPPFVSVRAGGAGGQCVRGWVGA